MGRGAPAPVALTRTTYFRRFVGRSRVSTALQYTTLHFTTLFWLIEFSGFLSIEALLRLRAAQLLHEAHRICAELRR